MQYIKSTFAPVIGVGTFTCLGLYPVINQTGTATGVTRGIYLNPTVTAAADFRAIEVTNGKSIINGPVTVNSTATPTAGLLLGAGSSAAGTAPLTENTTRYKLAKIAAGQVTTDFGGSLTSFNAFTTTITVVGAQPGDVVNVSANNGAVNPRCIIVTAYVTSANTVTLQAYNASPNAVTIATDTYKVRVIK
jgi:hypothetical protein